MNRLVFIGFIFIFFLCLLNIPLTSAEENYSDTQPKSEMLEQEAELDIYTEYQNAQEALWRDYQELRDEFINDYLLGKLKITYEDFKSKENSLRDKYIGGRKELLDKYFSEKNK